MKLSVSTVQSLSQLLAGTAAAAIAIAPTTAVWAAQGQGNLTNILAVSQVRSPLSLKTHSLTLPILQNSSNCPNNEPRDCPPHGSR